MPDLESLSCQELGKRQTSKVDLLIAPNISVVHETDDAGDTLNADLLDPIKNKLPGFRRDRLPTAAIKPMVSKRPLSTTEGARYDPHYKLGLVSGFQPAAKGLHPPDQL
jgi:hypothetical protein